MRLGLLAAALFAIATSATAAPPSFSVTGFSVNEDVGAAHVTIVKSGKAASYSKVQVLTVDGTAKAGTDYKKINTTITFANTVTSFAVDVPIIARGGLQGTRQFQVKLVAVRNAAVGAPATMLIQDASEPPIPPPLCPDGTPVPPSGTCPVVPPVEHCPDGSVQPPTGICPIVGEKPIPDNFDIGLATEYTWYGPPPTGSDLPANRGGIPPESPDEVSGFRFMCAAGQVAQFDPIVYPGQSKAGHIHQFWGNNSIQPDSNYSSMRQKGGSTCDNRSNGTIAVNRTGYWAPAMMDGAGNVVLPDFINTYYKQIPHNSPKCGFPSVSPEKTGICVDLPNGIKFVFGWNALTGKGGPNDLTSADQYTMWYECWSDLTGAPSTVPSARGQFHSIAALVKAGCPAGAVLVEQGVIPQCWDGKNVDSADHRSHLAAYRGDAPVRCPDDHPYNIVAGQFRLHYTTDANFVAGKWHLSCDMDGMEAGSCLHFDYMEAWSPAGKDRWFRNCIDKHLTAANGDLCDRYQMRDAGTPDGGWPRHRLVPAPQ